MDKKVGIVNEKSADIRELVRGEKLLREKIDAAQKEEKFKELFNLNGRLLNKYKKALKKALIMAENPNLSEEKKGVIVEKIKKLNEAIINTRNELKDVYKDAIKRLKGTKNLVENGELRKKYIDYIEAEIKELLGKSELSVDEKKYLQVLEQEFPQLIELYKKNLDSQYKDEILKSDASLVATFVALPKGCLISIKKIEACIKDVRNAKNNKDKAMKIRNVVQAIAGLMVTPTIYLGKFVLNSILLITIGTSLNLSDEKLRNFIDNVTKKTRELVEDISQNRLGKITSDAAIVGKVR